MYTLVIILIVFIIVMYQNARKYSDFCNNNSVFNGFGSDKTSKFLINSLNGSIMNHILENENTPILDWRKIIPEAQILIDNFDIIKKNIKKFY